jgi:hypothetical protein
LEDWKNNRDKWIQIIRPGSFVTTRTNDKSSTIRKFKIIEGEIDKRNNSTNGYGHISLNGKLAQKMLFKKIGDSFTHGDYLYEIISLEIS